MTFRTPQLEVAAGQRSHVLFVLSQPVEGSDEAFIQWYRDPFRSAMSTRTLRVEQYVEHEIDVSHGRFLRLPFRYVSICDISIDGAEEAESLIREIENLHAREPSTETPATWLYYPASERVGESPAEQPSMLTLAFANGTDGDDEAFREWYATRHIRHALNISVIVSGQVLCRTLFQRPGAMDATFALIAVYEQQGSPEEFLASAAALPKGLLAFPTLDVSSTRFSEAIYRPI